LQQVFLNLIINAVEAMSDPACLNRVLTVRTLVEQDNCVVIKVEDTGPGIGRLKEKISSSPFSRPSQTEWAWDYRSAERSSNRTAGI
jgi:C4-dicarboxylate-specific signal transduction histidine kinase